MTTPPPSVTEFPPADLERLVEQSWIGSIEYAPTMNSTNDRALELLREESRAAPFAVLTHLQTRGRGRGTHRWWAGHGAITTTLVVRPVDLGLPADRIPRLSLTIGLAICRLLGRWINSDQITLKWPNDVFVNGRKICGILIEIPNVDRPPGEGEADRPNLAIESRPVLIGIGLNVNNSLNEAPDEIRDRSTSLIDQTGRCESLLTIYKHLLFEVERHLNELRRQPQALLDQWKNHCLLTGREVVLNNNGELHAGLCLGIAESGGLLLQMESGARVFYSGQIHSY